MTEKELDVLADLIARELLRDSARAAAPKRPPGPRGPAPVWNQPIKEIAPPPTSQLAAREAAARRGLVEVAPREPRRIRPSALDPRTREVPIGVARHFVLLSDKDWRTLFGAAAPTVLRELRQPGQVAYRETVRAAGPRGELDHVRVLGPFRERSRVVVSRGDAHRLGIDAPVRLPGEYSGAAEVTLVGPAGSVKADAVLAAAHVHLPIEQAEALGIRDGARVSARCGAGGRQVTFHDLVAYVAEESRAELHLDSEEANAAGVRTGDAAVLTDLPRSPASGESKARGRRPLLTERDVDALAARGDSLSPHSPYLITPAARDRARHLGIWREQP
ncbi:MAG: hypothetical protein HY561_10380 [Gemmatimonadetes bacterium]|nr:hypothetical protein [Gemmatimonadota bacterium]